MGKRTQCFYQFPRDVVISRLELEERDEMWIHSASLACVGASESPDLVFEGKPGMRAGELGSWS